MNQWKFIIVFLLLITACKEETKLEVPAEDLAKVLRDVHIAEAAANDIPDMALKDSVLRVFYGQVYEMHGMDSAELHHNIELMKQDPVLTREVYVKVLDELNSISVGQ
ncbi:MAG: DUF4296 domain-containing protein [Bacteroidota bacterium]